MGWAVLSTNDRRLYQEAVALCERLKIRQLETLITTCRRELRERYPRNHRRTKAGLINRTFTAEEWQKFLGFVKRDKARLAFQLMHGLGLRIGEVVQLKLEHVDFLNRTVLIQTEKSYTKDLLPLYDGLFELLRDWVNLHHEAILNHQGYLLYSENPVQHRLHVSKDWLRNYFRRALLEAGLGQVYAMSNERRSGKQPRKLYRLNTHSGRRTFGTTLWRATGDLKLVQRALRQQDLKSTEPYVHVDQELVHAAITQAFSPQAFFYSPGTVPVRHKTLKEQDTKDLALCPASSTLPSVSRSTSLRKSTRTF